MSSYVYIFGTIIFTVYGQLVLKWRIGFYGAFPDNPQEQILFLIKLFFDPFIVSGFVGALVASMFWMAAMTKFELSHAYPFMAFNFVLVLVLSGILFNEAITLFKVAGVSLIIIGIIIGSQG